MKFLLGYFRLSNSFLSFLVARLDEVLHDYGDHLEDFLVVMDQTVRIHHTERS